MPSSSKRPRLALCLALVFVATATGACTRARPDPTSVLPGSAQSIAVIQPAAPEAGDAVGSPLELSGRVTLLEGQILVGQVLGPEGDALRWRGNATLDVDDAGAFSGAVSYTLAESGEGFVELLVIDAAGGTVIARHRIPVTLAAAP